MGFFSDYTNKNPAVDPKTAVDIEWVLRKLDGIGTANKASMGFAPSLPNETTTTKYLRQDGQWEVPPDTDTVYTHPTHTAQSSGLYKITVNSLGHVSAATAIIKAGITGLGIPGSDTNTTYSAGTGLMLSSTTFSINIGIIYPIGSISLSVNSANPGTWLPGTTWVAWGSGKVPAGIDTGQTEFNSVEKTGGLKHIR